MVRNHPSTTTHDCLQWVPKTDYTSGTGIKPAYTAIEAMNVPYRLGVMSATDADTQSINQVVSWGKWIFLVNVGIATEFFSLPFYRVWHFTQHSGSGVEVIRCEILQKRLTDWMNERWFGKLSWVFWFSGELKCDGNECKQQKIIQPNVPVSELYWKNLLSWDLALIRVNTERQKGRFLMMRESSEGFTETWKQRCVWPIPRTFQSSSEQAMRKWWKVFLPSN